MLRKEGFFYTTLDNLVVFNKRGVILTQISCTIHEREIKEKEEDKEIKYYQTSPVYILCKKKCVKITFLKI
jgi:hypothetical protein